MRWFLIRSPFYFRKAFFIKEEEITIRKGSDNIASSKARQNNLENKWIKRYGLLVTDLWPITLHCNIHQSCCCYDIQIMPSGCVIPQILKKKTVNSHTNYVRGYRTKPISNFTRYNGGLRIIFTGLYKHTSKVTLSMFSFYLQDWHLSVGMSLALCNTLPHLTPLEALRHDQAIPTLWWE